ncbi:hypothetical protein E2C01_026297 [Portunus trituberculatus]|uniref:Uncharacterized protein n=1 Tax=Portunus trituberculatus TaxID=210409 RepID=A0A5B7EIG6_PORTR|nr:hypothetical protein [Portunus trituberculatus]
MLVVREVTVGEAYTSLPLYRTTTTTVMTPRRAHASDRSMTKQRLASGARRPGMEGSQPALLSLPHHLPGAVLLPEKIWVNKLLHLSMCRRHGRQSRQGGGEAAQSTGSVSLGLAASGVRIRPARLGYTATHPSLPALCPRQGREWNLSGRRPRVGSNLTTYQFEGKATTVHFHPRITGQHSPAVPRVMLTLISPLTHHSTAQSCSAPAGVAMEHQELGSVPRLCCRGEGSGPRRAQRVSCPVVHSTLR